MLRLALSAALLAIALPGLALASVESELAYDRAVSAYDDGDIINARSGFEEVLREDPDDASALHYMGLIAILYGEIDTGIEHLERLVAHHPSIAPARVDLAIQYLKVGRDDEALEQLDAAVELEPDDALARLYQGVALYRAQLYEDAIESLERAAQLDARLSSEASYYVGLSNAYLGDARSAAAAFEIAAVGAPRTALHRSATKLHRLAERSARPWSLAANVGLEYNDNLRLSPDTDLSPPLVPQAATGTSSSGATAVALQGQVEAYANEAMTWRVGYDGDLLLYWNNDKDILTSGRSFSATDLSEQTHVGWTNATYDTSLASFGLRYDFSYTALDLTDSFRTIQRVAPTVYVPISNWGLFLAFYQFLYYDYDVASTNPGAFDRTGPQHSAGGRQFVFLPDPIDYLVVGALWSTYDSDGTEFRRDEIEISVGGEIDLPWKLSAGVLYSYSRRDYSEISVVATFPAPPTRRDEDEHEISFSVDRTFASRYNLSVAGSYLRNESNIDNFDINRFIIGTYLRYSF